MSRFHNLVPRGEDSFLYPPVTIETTVKWKLSLVLWCQVGDI